MTLVPPTEQLPPTPNPAPSPSPASDKPITCQFCECLLTPRGHALELSDKARDYRDQKESIAQLRARIAELESLNTEVTRERDDARRALTAAPDQSRRVRW